MLKFILVALVVFIVGVVIAAFFQPDAYRVSRSAAVPAPPSVVFAQVNDLHKFQEWSPFAKLDPNAKYTYSGPPAGKDAAFTWVGDANVGEGSMTIIESRPDDLIRFRLDFRKPLASTANAEFTFVPEGDQTKVTWTMGGENTFVGKVISLFMSMDKMIGAQFEKGLADLGAVSQKAAAQ